MAVLPRRGATRRSVPVNARAHGAPLLPHGINRGRALPRVHPGAGADVEPVNRELEAHLLRKGVDPDTARRLAEQSEPDDEVEVGETEATPAARPSAPALAEKYPHLFKP